MFSTDETTTATDDWHPEREAWWPSTPAKKSSKPQFTFTVIEDYSGSSLWTERGTLEGWRKRILTANAETKEGLLWLKGALFGKTPSEKSSYRYNANVQALTAIVVEHDDGTIAFDKAIATLKKAKLLALAYTSPSYEKKTNERWRLVLPLKSLIRKDVEQIHADLVARVNGVFGGALADESFTLSQSYYFGAVGGNPDHQCEIVQGDYLDNRTDLDAGRLFKNHKTEASPLSERKTSNSLQPRNEYQKYNQADRDKVRFALSKINADNYRTKWMECGAALAKEFGEEGRPIFHEWSNTSKKYNEKECDRKYNDFSRLSGYSIGTIFHHANEADPDWLEEYKEWAADGDASDDDKSPSSAKKKKKFTLVALDDVTISPEPVFLIEELIPAGPALVVFGGPPKKGKTFAVIDALLHVAMGKDFMGLKVQQGAVVYVTSEGIRGFDRRMVGARKYHKIEGRKVPFYTVHVMPNLRSKDTDARLLIEAITAALPEGVNLAAVVIDTLARAIPGKSDKEGTDMSEFVANCDVIAHALQCTTCVVHHAPRADEGRLRGANQLDGALDALIMVSRNEETKVSTATVTAAKDFEDGMSWRYEIRPIDLREPVAESEPKGNKAHGFRTVRTGVAHGLSDAARDDESARSDKDKTVRLPDKQKRFFEILCNEIVASGKKLTNTKEAPPGTIAITRDQLKNTLKKQGYFDTKATDNVIRARVSENLNVLAGKHLVGMNEGLVWCSISD